MSNDRPDKPPVDRCPTCWTGGRNTKLHHGACAVHGTTYPPVVPVPGQRCQIEDCRRNAVTQDCGVYVCEGHMGWKRGKAHATTVGGVNAHQTAGEPETVPPATPMHGPVCGGARIGWLSRACGTPLRYEHTANGIQYWRCPACGNPHWWPAAPTVPPPDGPFPVSEPALSWEAAIARDLARREGAGGSVPAPTTPTLDPATHAHIVEALGTAIDRTAYAIGYGSRTYVTEVGGLLVAARAARVALSMQLPQTKPPTS